MGIRKASISYIPSDRNIRTSFDVKVHDGKEEKIENKSTGTQFITVIELFLNYINKFNRNGILSIDEIESTLHPTIAKKVVSIASKKVKQLIFTTHSKDLLRIVPFANIVKVAKNNNVSEVNVLQNNPNKLYPLIYQWPEIFFNDSLLVCEGKESALIESFIANDTILSKNAAALNLEVINGGGRAVSQFLTHASLIKGKINCAFIYDAEYLDKKRKEEYSITLKMLKFNSANMEDIALFESFSTFEERKSFLKKFDIFIMSKKDASGKGGVEHYYKKDFGPQDLKEKPLFLASEVLQGKKIDDFFETSEYLETLKEILNIDRKV